MKGKVFLFCLLAAALTILLTPLAKRIAINMGAMDAPSKRKVHTVPMPRMGGLAIYLSFWITVFASQTASKEVMAFFIGSLFILVSGIWDDCRNISPKMKLLFQAAAALTVIFGGITVDFLSNPFGKELLFLEWMSYPVTFLWIIGMTNAVNLIDGLDGLAAGTSAIASCAIGVVALMNGQIIMSSLAFILAASTFGFLKYNFHPASIFMGDTGALFLGYALAVLSLMGMTKTATTVAFFLPIIILEVPIFDTLFAIVRRASNDKPIFSADKDHLHHRLLAMGLSHTQAVLLVYGICLFLSISAICISLLPENIDIIGGIFVTLLMAFGAAKTGLLGNKKKESK